jgi:hypothetical protein
MADFLAKEAQQGRAYPHELWRFALRLDALDQPLGKVWHGVYPEMACILKRNRSQSSIFSLFYPSAEGEP